MSIIVPRRKILVEEPLIFLAGPILGAPAWRHEAINYIQEMPGITIAAPMRAPETDGLELLEGEEGFERQRPWEKHYLNIAGHYGSILFWLPGEETHNCKKAYGATTRFEIGQALIERKFNANYNVVIGSDGNFPELRTLVYDINTDAPDLVIHKTLEDTCHEAMWKATTYKEWQVPR